MENNQRGQDSSPGCSDLNAMNEMFEDAGWIIKERKQSKKLDQHHQPITQE